MQTLTYCVNLCCLYIYILNEINLAFDATSHTILRINSGCNYRNTSFRKSFSAESTVYSFAPDCLYKLPPGCFAPSDLYVHRFFSVSFFPVRFFNALFPYGGLAGCFFSGERYFLARCKLQFV